MNELVQLIKDLSTEVHSLRKEVSELKYEIQSKKLSGTFMDMKEACEFLHISLSTMKNRLSAGEFPWAVKKGGKWMFSAEKLRKYASNAVS